MLSSTKLREFAWAFAALTIVTLTALGQQTRDLYAVPDRGDPLFSMWRMGWVRHQLAADPRHLFDANIFYPLPATLTYSDSMILPALASAPLAWVHPVVAYNLTLLAAFIVSGAAAYMLARALGTTPLGAWIAAMAFTIAPFRMNHLSHLELQMTMWMPVALLTTYRMLSDGDGGGTVLKPWRSAILAVILAAQWYSSMYYGLFLTMYVAVFGTVLIARREPRKRRLWQLIAAVCVAAILVSPLILVYVGSAPDRGDRPRDTVAAFSAVPADYVRSVSRNPIYRRLLPRPLHAERALFPGAATIALAAAGAWPPLTAWRVAALGAGVVAFDGSLGLNGVLYPLLYRVFPPLHSVRAPARFAILVVLTLALLAGSGAARLLAFLRRARARMVAVAALTLVIIADGWPHSDGLPVWRSPPTIYAALPARAVLFEFPVHSPADRFSENLPYMYFSMWHWRPLVNGYSGFIPASYDALLQGVSTFPEPPALQYLERVGVTHIALHCRLWEPDVCVSMMARLDATPRMRRLARTEWYSAPSTLYELVSSR